MKQCLKFAPVGSREYVRNPESIKSLSCAFSSFEALFAFSVRKMWSKPSHRWYSTPSRTSVVFSDRMDVHIAIEFFQLADSGLLRSGNCGKLPPRRMYAHAFSLGRILLDHSKTSLVDVRP